MTAICTNLHQWFVFFTFSLSLIAQNNMQHWHGIHMKHLNQFDGAASVTQCPIVPGHSFQYNVTIPDQSGTYWYHSHLGTQYCDGLRWANNSSKHTGRISINAFLSVELLLSKTRKILTSGFTTLTMVGFTVRKKGLVILIAQLESTVISMSDWYHAFSKDVVTQNASEWVDASF